MVCVVGVSPALTHFAMYLCNHQAPPDEADEEGLKEFEKLEANLGAGS